MPLQTCPFSPHILPTCCLPQWYPWALQTISSTSLSSCHRTTASERGVPRPHSALTSRRRSWARISSTRYGASPVCVQLLSLGSMGVTPCLRGVHCWRSLGACSVPQSFGDSGACYVSVQLNSSVVLMLVYCPLGTCRGAARGPDCIGPWDSGRALGFTL